MGSRLLFHVPGLALALFLPTGSSAQDKYHDPGPVISRILDAAPTPTVVLSPDRARFLIMDRAPLQPIAEVAAPELGLAGVRLDPRTNAPSRAVTYSSLVIQPMQGEVRRIVIPWQSRVGQATWAPDGQTLAFTLVESSGVSLWIAEASTGDIRLLLGPVLNAAFGDPCSWLPSGTGLVCSRIPEDRSSPPADAEVPAGPIIRDSRSSTTPKSPEADLLQNPGDEALFKHYFASQLIIVPLSGQVRPIGEKGLHSSASVSPDGRYLLVQTVHGPFSHAVSWRGFGTRSEVWDINGRLIREVGDRSPQEIAPQSRDSVQAGPRGIGWRPDTAASLAWVEAVDGGNPLAQASSRDRLVVLGAPFAGSPVAIAEFSGRAGSVTWSRQNLGLVSERWERTRRSRTWVIDPSKPGTAPRLLLDRSSEDRKSDPGSFLKVASAGGDSLLLTSKDGRFAFLVGTDGSPDGGRPFLDRLELATGKSLRLFRSEPPFYEEPVTMLDPDAGRVLSRREGVNEPPNYYIRDFRKSPAVQLSQLTRFKDPAEEFAGVRSQLVPYSGSDGIQLYARLYFPPGYDRSQGPLPFLIWTQPSESLSGDTPGPNGVSPFRFIRPSGVSPLFLLLEGYGVLETVSLPAERSPEALVAGVRSAVDNLVALGVADPRRVAVGGYLDGAVLTARLMARSNLFKAGIALELPPTFADSIRGPLLVIQGTGEDGQERSERRFAAMTDRSDSTRLVLLPAESRRLRARESVGHALYEMSRWMGRYVKAGTR